MVRRNPELSFGGMWTFPGGSLDPGDGPIPAELDEDAQNWAEPTLVGSAATAAHRELFEEVGLRCVIDSMEWFSHWIPPRKHGPAKRFATWFFLGADITGDIVVDTTENSEARWVSPATATREGSTDFPLAVPTWVTLDDIGSARSAEELIRMARDTGPRMHHTRAQRDESNSILYWTGDRAYDDGDLDAAGPRNRVHMTADGTVVARLSD